MRATELEFRYRFWFISATFAAGFACYRFDHRLAAETLARTLGWTGRAGLTLVILVGAVIAYAAAAIRTWAAAYLHSSVVKDGALHSDRLVADGPYRHVRNPLYLGTLLLGVAWSFLASPLGSVIIVLGLFIIVLRLIGREEASLLAAQGAGYQAYREAVPSLWPAFQACLPGSGARPAWRQAITGELMMWVFATGIAAFAVTLKPWLLYTFLVAGFIGYFRGARRAATTGPL